MVIQLDNGGSVGGEFEPFWDASWISNYAEEDERLWFGSIFGLRVQTVIIVDSGKNYRKIFDAFYKFDALLSAEFELMKMDIRAKEIAVIKFAIASIFDAQTQSELDTFPIDSFYAYTRNKTIIHLNLFIINHIRSESLVDLAMYRVAVQDVSEIRNDNTNLFKPILFDLFPKLRQITINTADQTGQRKWAFNPLSLLSILNGAAVPESFETIKIEDRGENKWLTKAFSQRVRGKYAESNLAVKHERTFDGNVVFISFD